MHNIIKGLNNNALKLNNIIILRFFNYFYQ